MAGEELPLCFLDLLRPDSDTGFDGHEKTEAEQFETQLTEQSRNYGSTRKKDGGDALPLCLTPVLIGSLIS